MKTNNKFIVTALLVLLITSIVVGCSSNNNKNSNEAASSNKGDSLKTVRFNAVSTYVPLMISKEKGWMEEEFAKIGVKVEWLTFQTGAAGLEALAGGHLDIGSVAPTPTITATANGVDLKAIATVAVFSKANALLVHKDSDIQKLQDLKGKKIGVAKGTMSYDLVNTALKEAGLTASDVELIQLLPDEGQAAFESKKVDVWGIWDPFVSTQVVQNGARVLTDGEQLKVPNPNFAVVRSAFAEEHPEYVELFLKVNQQSADWLRDHKEEAITFFAENRKLDKTLVSHLAENNPVAYEPISDDFIQLEKKVAQQLLDDKTVKTLIDPTTFIDNSYFEAALKNPLEKR
ncbi:aliphatic sulfonate ABC transporter substrate-binding protein [Cohnella sp. WQ 127256]|uniref:aliphatic sulfonate ABC transporter substrate-binding protein n=1 Tax=Cohnella sp. WQ 127256 TaxID=2938790 RepID=UPI0021173603|nr:aliphatic sulfonate ABC transporter substrate-binding protein [Cohnella sp. WQ 127256]